VQKHQHIWKFFSSRKASNIVASVGMVALLGTLFVGHGQDTRIKSAQTQAQASIDCALCATFQRTASTNISRRIRPQPFATRKAIAHPAVVTAPPTRNIPVRSTPTTNPPARSTPTTNPPTQTGTATPVPSGPNPGVNVFPYPSCTWWADQRYYQLHGIFVPWHSQANAWQWTDRAYQYGWHVSSSPVTGAIINLQPGVQGAGGLGHVGVVERILSNGHVVASNMSWGAYPSSVTDVEFTPGPGVTFLWQ
jgi:surface antigen